MIEMRFSRVLQRPEIFMEYVSIFLGLGWVVGAITNHYYIYKFT